MLTTMAALTPQVTKTSSPPPTLVILSFSLLKKITLSLTHTCTHTLIHNLTNFNRKIEHIHSPHNKTKLRCKNIAPTCRNSLIFHHLNTHKNSLSTAYIKNTHKTHLNPLSLSHAKKQTLLSSYKLGLPTIHTKIRYATKFHSIKEYLLQSPSSRNHNIFTKPKSPHLIDSSLNPSL